jgi:acetoacetyl-CoA synthetase
MNNELWTPSKEHIEATEMYRFQKYLEDKFTICFEDHQKLHQWSIDNSENFWEAVWDFCGIKSSTPYSAVLQDGNKFPGAKWFPGSRLNFAENLLRYRDEKPALVSLLENGERKEISYAELYQKVSQLAAALRADGVAVGDRVAGFMPNIAETVIAMLAVTSIGAIWSSCSPDFGINGVVDRFGQIEPKVLFSADGYYYNNKNIDSLSRLKEIRQNISSIEKIIVIPLTGSNPDLSKIDNAILFDQYLQTDNTPTLVFEQLPFDHPLYVMYSSGTTGVPKCIVHGAGGTLIQHLKEMQLHTNVTRDDVLFYYTTCGWMMWNWLVSGLACGCTLLLYDGSPFAKEGHILIDAIDSEKISIFGTSAKFIASLEKAGIKPRESHQLDSLKAILSTGSPLSHESFTYVYRDIKSDLCLSSISGGTDIISCFVLGSPTLPVYTGELQCPGLGMEVEIWNDHGISVTQEKGELVCTAPFPSCPVSFWNDPENKKFHSAYFDNFDNVWAHGDYGEITAHNGMIIHGRSDAVLNPGGVRIGTAEIYRQVEKVDEVVEAIVIGQEWKDDVRVILFVVLRENIRLDESLAKEIKSVVRANTTPRHVPGKIIQVTEIPRTISGKIVELAVRNVVHNRPVKNTDALANPDALELYRDLAELQCD